MKYKFTAPIALGALVLSHHAIAGGLSLPQIGTAESTGTAGVSNVTNNRDASAVITNPAALSGIEDSSWVLGLQYLDVNNDFENADSDFGTNGSSGQFMPHISYATRLNDQWVVGIASHAPGGLGIEYSNGLTGGSDDAKLLESNMIAIMNITTSASFQVNDQFSLGGSIIAQYAGIKSEGNTPYPGEGEITGSDWSPSFALSGLYQVNDQTHVGLTYNYGAQHDVSIEASNTQGSTSLEINWPQSVEIGLQHNLSDDVALMVSANWQEWSKFGENYDDTYGAGIAMSYQLDSWKLHTGFSADSSPLTAENRGYMLPLDEQWRLGFGAEKKLNNGMTLGLAYQYQSLGNAEISNEGLLPSGEYSDNRVHFITGSLSF